MNRTGVAISEFGDEVAGEPSTSSMKQVRSLTACLVAAVLVAAGCAGGDRDDTGSAGADSPGIRTGGELVYALEAESAGGFCIPSAQLAASGMVVVSSIYDPLTVPTADGEWAPYLLESFEPNETATAFTLKLREGITFHDGTPLDSTVLKDNLDAWAGRYPNRTSLLWALAFEPIDTIEVVDDLTVEVTTKVPWPAFPGYLNGGGRLGIMAQAQLDDPENCDRNLIGTGPYVLEEWAVNDRLTADRNPDYWATDEQGNQLPYLDRIEFVPVVDSQNRMNGLLAGEYGAGMFRRAAPTEVLDEESEAGSVEVNQSVEGSQVVSLMLNHARPPFDDPQAREAVALALDREQYREVVALGTTELASGPFPPGTPGHLDEAGFPDHDLDRARELVSDYEERTGSELEFSYLHSATIEDTQAAQFVQDQLEAAGMKVSLQPREQATLINEALGSNWQMMLIANFPGGEPDANYVWWHSDSPINLPRIQDAEVDSLLETARSELDESTATDLYEQVNRRLNEQVHYIWLNQLKWTIATDPSISGVYGPTLPSGEEPTRSLASGHPTVGLHYTQ